MESAGYPELPALRELHRHLLSPARDMQMWIEFGERYVPAELSHFRYNWLVDRNQAVGKKFSAFMTGQGGQPCRLVAARQPL